MKTTKIIAIANQKGGVGKTSTTVNLGYILVKAIRIYLGNPDEFGIIYVQGTQDFSNNMPLPVSIWLIVYLVLQLFLKESLLSIKGQYLTHITHLFLIQWKACDSDHYKRKEETG